MAGKKGLLKFHNSKIPKKGTGTTKVDLLIYQEPNTHSQIIGKVNKNEIINWISKSFCQEKEWIRCDNKNNFGYIICDEMDGDGTNSLNMDSIQEKKEENNLNLYLNKYFNNESQITNEEYEIGNEALRQILEEDEKKDYNNTLDNTENNSIYEYSIDNFDDTEEEINMESKSNEILEEDKIDYLHYNGDASKLDWAIKEKQKKNKMLSNILNLVKNDKKQENNISKSLESINDILSTKENNHSNKDLKLSVFDSNPKGNERNDQYKDNHNGLLGSVGNIASNANTVVENVTKGMKEIEGTIRLTNGAYNGNKFSPKLYESGWKGGGKARIKTYNVSKIGSHIEKSRLKFGLGIISKAKKVNDIFKEDGSKIGDKITVAISKEIGGKAGAKIGERIGTTIGFAFGPFGAALGMIIGRVVGEFVGEKVGEKAAEILIEKKKEKGMK